MSTASPDSKPPHGDSSRDILSLLNPPFNILNLLLTHAAAIKNDAICETIYKFLQITDRVEVFLQQLITLEFNAVSPCACTDAQATRRPSSARTRS